MEPGMNDFSNDLSAGIAANAPWNLHNESASALHKCNADTILFEFGLQSV